MAVRNQSCAGCTRLLPPSCVVTFIVRFAASRPICHLFARFSGVVSECGSPLRIAVTSRVSVESIILGSSSSSSSSITVSTTNSFFGWILAALISLGERTISSFSKTSICSAISSSIDSYAQHVSLHRHTLAAWIFRFCHLIEG